MYIYKSTISNEEKLTLVGFGYVGIPIAVAFATKGLSVIGFDFNKARL